MIHHALLLAVLCLGLAETTAPPIGDTLEQLEQRVREAGEIEARIAALTEVAGMQPEGEAPTAEITRVVALGLADEAPSVRAHAATLLGREQHAETCVSELVRALRAEQVRWEDAADELVDQLERAGKSLQKNAKLPEARRKNVLEEVTVARRARTEALRETSVPLDAIVEQLGGWPDRRAEAALLSLLKTTSKSELRVCWMEQNDVLTLSMGFLSRNEEERERLSWELVADRDSVLHDALFRLRTRTSVEAICGSMAAWLELSDAVQERYDEFVEEQRGQGASIRTISLSSNRNTMRAYAAGIASRIRKFAEQHSLPAPPAFDAGETEWQAWRRTIAPELTASLGRVSSDE